MQPVATCRQSPYLHKPAIVIVTSFSWWRRSPTALAAPVLIMTSLIVTSFATELVTPIVTDERTYATDTLPRLYKDTQQLQLSLSKHTSYNANTRPIYLNIQKCNVFDNGTFREFWGLVREFLTFKTVIPVGPVCKPVRPMLSDRCPVLSICDIGVLWPKRLDGSRWNLARR